jgi:hypothetical protein
MQNHEATLKMTAQDNTVKKVVREGAVLILKGQSTDGSKFEVEKRGEKQNKHFLLKGLPGGANRPFVTEKFGESIYYLKTTGDEYVALDVSTGKVTTSSSPGLEVDFYENSVRSKPLVWSKSGPPTHEIRMSSEPSTRGQQLPALIDNQNPARLGQAAIISLRRDLNGLLDSSKDGCNGQLSAVATLLTPGEKPGGQKKVLKESDPDDLSDDELWESIGRTSEVTRAELKKTAIAQINARRCIEGKKQ